MFSSPRNRQNPFWPPSGAGPSMPGRRAVTQNGVLACVILMAQAPDLAAAAGTEYASPPSAIAKPLHGPHPAKATARPRAPGREAGGTAEEIQVNAKQSLAHGLMRPQSVPETVSTITSEAIAQKQSGASPMQLLASAPGVNFGSSNGYELTVRRAFSVRGLDVPEVGWTLEGAPITDQANFFAFPESAVDNENLAGISLLQGTSRLQDPVESSAGGEAVMTVRAPSDKMGGDLSYSYGSYRTHRVFARYDSGYIGHSGVKLFGSYSYTAGDNFAGSGRSTRQHVDFKVTKDWTPDSWSSLYLAYNDWFLARNNQYTLAQWESANRAGNNFSATNYASTYTSTYTPGVTTNYWNNQVYARKDLYLSSQNSFELTPRLTFHVTPYFHWIKINQPGQTTASINSLYNGDQKETIDPAGLYTFGTGQFSALANALQEEYSAGVNAYFNYNPTATNQLVFGYWHDHWAMNQTNGLAPLDAAGNPTSYWGGSSNLRAVNGALISGADYQIGSEIDALYISDTQSFLRNRLKLTVGFKQFMDHLSGTNLLSSSQYHFSDVINQPLPRVMVSYQINDQMQVYLNGTTSVRPPVPLSSYPVEYSASTGKVTQSQSNNVKPEYSIGEELGFRYHGLFNADLALFNMNLTNHQVSVLTNQGGATVSAAISAGGETIRGISAELAPAHGYYGLTPYVNAQYLHATIDNDIRSGSDFLPTAGKEMVMSPKFLVNIGLLYEHGPYFANLMFKYVDSQYSTFMNDQSMPAYKTVDLGLGYKLPKFSVLSNPVIKLNFTNLSNVPYLAGISTVQGNAVATKGVHGTIIAAATPNYYMAVPLTVMMTVSAGF